MWKPSARGWGAAVAIAALVAGPSLPASAAPLGAGAASGIAPSNVVRDDYPTWDQVNAAKANEQAKQAEVTNINALLDGLEAESARLANEALQRGQEYLKATYDLQAATGYADTLSAQADTATADADRATAQLGKLAAQLYRSSGDSTLNLILNQNDSDSLLYQLGTMSKITEQTALVQASAESARNTADALTKQAQTAEAERDRLAQEADARLQDAEAAQADADAQLASAQATSATLVAQLSTLKDTTVQVETAYRAGEAAKAEELARQRAAAAAAAAATDAPGSAWVPSSSEIASPAEAQAYAQSILGNYGWGGDQYTCLVRLWIGESGWRVNAYNASSGAYGIPQSLPASKMASVGSDYVTSASTQIIWGMNYISDRYGTPCSALSQWTARNPHWY